MSFFSKEPKKLSFLDRHPILAMTLAFWILVVYTITIQYTLMLIIRVVTWVAVKSWKLIFSEKKSAIVEETKLEEQPIA